MKPLTIGQVAKDSGVGVETIRFYEREGLIGKAARLPSGYRQYDPEVIRRIRFIQRGKDLGFSLREIGELLSLRLARRRACADVKTRATAKIADVESKIAALERMKSALMRLTEACAGRGSVSECPILDALDADEKAGA